MKKELGVFYALLCIYNRMKSIIKKILLEQTDKVKKSHLQKLYTSNLKKVAFKLIEKYEQKNDGWVSDYERALTLLGSKLGLTYADMSFYIFTYLIEDNDDPTEHRGLSDWLYRTPTGDELEFLKISGYYKRFIDIKSFHDLKFEEDGKIYMEVDGWMDFAYLFENASIAEEVFGEDWLQLWDLWDADLEEICNHLNTDTINYLVDVIASENEYLVELGHREEFEEIVSEDGVLSLTTSNVAHLKTMMDSYNIHLLIEESNLSGGDIEQHLRSSYNSSYNLAAEDELFKKFKGEIEDYLGSKVELHPDGDGLIVDVTDSVTGFVDTYMEESIENPMDQHTTMLDMLNGLTEFYTSTLSVGDLGYYYPSHEKIEDHFNYMVKENY